MLWSFGTQNKEDAPYLMPLGSGDIYMTRLKTPDDKPQVEGALHCSLHDAVVFAVGGTRQLRFAGTDRRHAGTTFRFPRILR